MDSLCDILLLYVQVGSLCDTLLLCVQVDSLCDKLLLCVQVDSLCDTLLLCVQVDSLYDVLLLCVQVGFVEEAFRGLRQFLVIASNSKQPSQVSLMARYCCVVIPIPCCSYTCTML